MGLPWDSEDWDEGKGQAQGQSRELGRGQRIMVRG